MNRKQARTAKKQNRRLDLTDPRMAQQMLEATPAEALVAGINNSIDILQRRGIHILDWDQKERELYRIKVFGSRIYFLASLPEPDGVNSGEDEIGGAEK